MPELSHSSQQSPRPANPTMPNPPVLELLSEYKKQGESLKQPQQQQPQKQAQPSSSPSKAKKDNPTDKPTPTSSGTKKPSDKTQ